MSFLFDLDLEPMNLIHKTQPGYGQDVSEH